MGLSNNKVSITVATGTADEFSGWFSCDTDFRVRIVGTYTGDVVVQTREDENDTNVGVVETYTSTETEEVGRLNDIKQSMQYRIGTVAGVVGTPYCALIK